MYNVLQSFSRLVHVESQPKKAWEISFNLWARLLSLLSALYLWQHYTQVDDKNCMPFSAFRYYTRAMMFPQAKRKTQILSPLNISFGEDPLRFAHLLVVAYLALWVEH